MKKTIIISGIYALLCVLPGRASAAETGKNSFDFEPDTITLRTSWKEFFRDPIYTRLDAGKRRDVADRLFTELIASDTSYIAWASDLQNEAKNIFYSNAGFPPPGKSEAAAQGLSAEKVIKTYDAEETAAGQAQKEKRLGSALARDRKAELPSSAAEPDKNVKPTEIPKANPDKLPMPVGRSWFKNDPLEDIRTDPDFIGYMVLIGTKHHR